jgi:hypothetical protein
MLRLDLDTAPGGVRVHHKKGRLNFNRRDGSRILTINAPYADDRALETAARVLNFLFRGQYGSYPDTESARTENKGDNLGDGPKA